MYIDRPNAFYNVRGFWTPQGHHEEPQVMNHPKIMAMRDKVWGCMMEDRGTCSRLWPPFPLLWDCVENSLCSMMRL